MPLMLSGVCSLAAGCAGLADRCGIDSVQAGLLCRSTLLIMHSGSWLFHWTLAAVQGGDLHAGDASYIVEVQANALLACLLLAERRGALASTAAECVLPDRLVDWVQRGNGSLSLLTPRPGGCCQLLPAASAHPVGAHTGVQSPLERCFGTLRMRAHGSS